MKSIPLAILCSVALLLGGWWSYPALAEEEVTGFNPTISGTVPADCGTNTDFCADSFETKCLQSSRFLDIFITDSGGADCIQLPLSAPSRRDVW